MPLRVYCPKPPPSPFAATVRDLLDPSVEISFVKPPEPARWQVLVDGRPTRELLHRSPDLQALVIPYAGLPAATRELCREFPQISIHNLHHNAAPAAEHAVALMLAASKRIVPTDVRLRRGDWRPNGIGMPLLLEGRTALVIGFGAIGSRIARACQGLGMHVEGIRRSTGSRSIIDGIPVHGSGMLRALLPRAHVVFLSVPLTECTRGMIGRDELHLLPDDAVLVNVARGGVVDEQALFDGLQINRPAAAGLDVWYRYPENAEARAHTRPSNLGFEKLDNVVMSSHRGGTCDSIEALRGAHLAILLNVAASGQPMHNPVDLAAGY